MKPLNYGRSTYIKLFFFRGFLFVPPSSSPYMKGFWDTAGCSIPPNLRVSRTVYTIYIDVINPWIQRSQSVERL